MANFPDSTPLPVIETADLSAKSSRRSILAGMAGAALGSIAPMTATIASAIAAPSSDLARLIEDHRALYRTLVKALERVEACRCAYDDAKTHSILVPSLLVRLRRSWRSKLLSPIGFTNDHALRYGDVSPEYFHSMALSGDPATGKVTYHEGFEVH